MNTPWTVLNIEREISQFTNQSEANGIQFGRGKNISEGVVVSENGKCWGIIQIVSEVITDGPFQS